MSVKHVHCHECNHEIPLVDKKIPEHSRKTFTSMSNGLPNYVESICPGGNVNVYEPEEIEFNLEPR